jgi:hypothetical protein
MHLTNQNHMLPLIQGRCMDCGERPVRTISEQQAPVVGMYYVIPAWGEDELYKCVAVAVGGACRCPWSRTYWQARFLPAKASAKRRAQAMHFLHDIGRHHYMESRDWKEVR